MASHNRDSRGQRLQPLAAALLAITLGFGMASAQADDLPKIPTKKPLKVGFAQTESNNPWRLAQTQSMKDEAAKRGWQLWNGRGRSCRIRFGSRLNARHWRRRKRQSGTAQPRFCSTI